MPTFEFALIASLVAKDISKAVRAKKPEERKAAVIRVIEMLVAYYRDDAEAMDAIRRTVGAQATVASPSL